MAFLSKLVSISSLASVALAGTPIPNIIPFTVTGSLDDCQTSGSGHNAGGTIRINNFAITIPENLLVQYPTAFSGFPELCGAGAGGYETTVVGNVVGGKAIAGQVVVANRFGLEGSQGYIEEINSDDSTVKIRGGPWVRLNDHEGLFAKKTDSAPLWAVDTENPSVSSFSGFPMCIPYKGNTDKCSDTNRPNNALSFAAPNPLKMVPFRVGDFVEYAGKLVGSEVLAFEMTAINVQVTTRASDTVPNYIRVEDMLIGVPDNSPNVEFADVKVIGFLSSCSGAVVSIHAKEIDPCTGEEKLRQIGTATPRQETRCKWEARIDSQPLAPYTREYLIKTNSPVIETDDGIKAGQYVTPVTEWIFPEVDVPGTEPPPYPFSDIRGLVQGDFLDNQQFGPLNPWPGVAPPKPSKTCSPDDIPGTKPSSTPSASPTSAPEAVEPVAAISPVSSTQRSGVRVVLSGSNTASNIPSGNLVYEWTKTSPSSPSVSLTNPAQASCTFIAPKVNTETSFVFELKVSLKDNPEKFSKANITVKINPTIPDTVTINSYTWESRQSGTISVSCSTNVINGDSKKMNLLINANANGVGTNLVMTAGPTAGSWVYQARSINRPTNLRCVSPDLLGRSDQILGTATTGRRRRWYSNGN